MIREQGTQLCCHKRSCPCMYSQLPWKARKLQNILHANHGFLLHLQMQQPTSSSSRVGLVNQLLFQFGYGTAGGGSSDMVSPSRKKRMHYLYQRIISWGTLYSDLRFAYKKYIARFVVAKYCAAVKTDHWFSNQLHRHFSAMFIPVQI